MLAQHLYRQCDIAINPEPLVLETLPDPTPGHRELLLKVSACGVCHTELDEIEGRTLPPTLPVIPGHQVIGRVEERGKEATRFVVGTRVGVAWIYSACGQCRLCQDGLENLCQQFLATGRDADGGYAQFMRVPEHFAYPIPEYLEDVEAAPLLCAGAIGFRSLALTGIKNGDPLGLTGFGGSGHLVLKMVRHCYPDTEVSVFARSPVERAFALELGAVWAGASNEEPPSKLKAVIDTTPAWKPVVAAMQTLVPGGRLVINAIRKEKADQDALLELQYPRDLWMEKEIKSVANVGRADVSGFLALAEEMQIRPEVETYPLAQANRALYELKKGNIRGTKVLTID